MLSATDLTVRVLERALVEAGSVQVTDGETVALVGRNGVGKSTLLGALAGTVRPQVVVDGSMQSTGTTAFLHQESADLDTLDRSALEFVVAARDLDALETQLEAARRAMQTDSSGDVIETFVDLEEHYRNAGGYTSETDVARICAGLGLDENHLLEPVRSLSGGQRRRVALARVLYRGATNVILDEPTNHLDAAGKRWLREHLEASPQAILIVSHDLPLLDSSVDRVIELSEGRLTSFGGNYTHYRKVLAERAEIAGRRVSREDREIRRLRDRAASMRGRSTRVSRVAKAIDRRVGRLEGDRTERVQVREPEKLRMPPASRGNTTPLTVEELGVEYVEGKPLLAGLSFSLARGERLLVLGPNGGGKSTLLRCIVGEQPPTSGHVRVGPQTDVGYFAQHHELLDPARSALEHLYPDVVASESEARNRLGTMGLRGGKALQPVASLSGGERTKASLAILVATPRSVLVLDEPTNNLDMPAARRLGELLGAWNGTLVVVSHDVGFVGQLAPTHCLTLPRGTLRHWQPDDLERVAI